MGGRGGRARGGRNRSGSELNGNSPRRNGVGQCARRSDSRRHGNVKSGLDQLTRWFRPHRLQGGQTDGLDHTPQGTGRPRPALPQHLHGKQRLLPLLLLLLTDIPVRLSRGDAVAHAERRQSV